MFFEKVFFFLSLLHLVNLHLQINLHLTDWESEDNNFQHDCLQVPAHIIKDSDPRQIISYCMSEFPSKFRIKDNNHDQKFTFEQLSKQKITNQQLYQWSASIDLIEEYQFYLNEISKSEKSSLSTRVFYNCTLPYFGSQCQYVLEDYKSYHSSLDEIIHDYYRCNIYKPTLLTCYIHLECNRGPSPSCLDWTEICDGKVDCLDDGYDEEHCWKMEIQPYNKDEDPHNKDCISEAFFRDDSKIPNCAGNLNSMEISDLILNEKDSSIEEPTFKHEDVSCAKWDIFEINKFHFFLSSCNEDRLDILSQAIFSIKPKSLSDECWTALKCILRLSVEVNSINSIFCDQILIEEIINKTCPDIIYTSAVPVLFGHIYLVYEKNMLTQSFISSRLKPTYFCYNDQFLHILNDSEKIILPHNHTCHFYNVSMLPIPMRELRWIHRYIFRFYKWLHSNTIIIDKNFELLDKSMLYKCINQSKYISKYRLSDGVIDCHHKDDEELLNKTCPQEQNVNYFKCQTTNECILQSLVQNGICDCTRDYDYEEICDDEYNDTYFDSEEKTSFQTVCDEYKYRTWQIDENQKESPEPNCEKWPLIHVYNRCDGFWHRLDGSDEINCDPSPLLNCPTNHHICVSLNTSALMCLPMEKANDGIVDCLGAADEPILCRHKTYGFYPTTFYCSVNDGIPCAAAREICDNDQICGSKEDEQACGNDNLSGVSVMNGICTGTYESDGSDVVKVLCRRFTYTFTNTKPNFTLDQWPNLIKRHLKQETTLSHQSIERTNQSYQPRCHRGLNLQVWLDKQNNLTGNTCLCPPSYYGEICQYQNQRVSLTLQFTVTSDSVKTLFAIIVSLTDDTNERIIHSYEQFTYLSFKHCIRKFNIYLLYSTRPKDETKEYSIHIDIYEKTTTTLDYRASFIKSLNFSFLPVHRVAFQVDIPRATDNVDDCSDIQCFNGKCRKYVNDQKNRTFCQCHEGWSGRSCTIPYTSTCSFGSLSLGKLANNRSLCVCPMNKMGPRCLIDYNAICQNTSCVNQGECIPVDEYKTAKEKFVCLCRRGFTGDQCKIKSTQLTITFDKNISLPSSILIHFIEVKLDAPPVRTTTFKTVPFGQNSMIVYWSLSFHLVFVEIPNNTYYLVHMQTIYNQSENIKKSLNSSDQCLNIKQFFNETFTNSSFHRLIKYYHLPCQTNQLQLKCFYDKTNLCLCQRIAQQYVANCFKFNHSMNLNCFGKSGCENGGQCFQENTICPKIFVCQCPQCYYGARCQFSTSGFSLSLDAILGFHIQPNLNISHQPLAVLISLILTVIITLIGFVNGILSLITFQNKTARESGSGLYLFSSSVVVLLTMCIFLLKFVILLLSQMNTITNQSFLNIQCYSIDFLLRFCVTMYQWLTAFVGIERIFVVIKGMNFNKKKFKVIAKWTINGLILMSILTNIHDPIYRKLFIEDDNVDDDKRIWCIVQYSSAIRIVNLIVNILHFIVPFIINLISAVIIIVMSTRQQAAVKKNQKYRKLMNEQIEKHKNLLIGPCVLIILGIPRLIISFTSGCMKSASNSWLFLLGYFVSLIPSLLTFVLFVLPSSTYKKAFRKAISRYRNLINRRS